MTKEQENLLLQSRVLIQGVRIKKLLEVSEDLATALLELNPDSELAIKVIKNWETVRDWVNQ